MEEVKFRFIMYLDYDGVLNSENYFVKMHDYFIKDEEEWQYRNFMHQFCIQKEAVECLNKVYDKFPFCIILTATRRYEFSCTEWNFFFNKMNKVKAYIGGVTGKDKNNWRENEIEEYHFKDCGMFSLKNQPFIIIDDDKKDLQKFKDKLINTDFRTGLTIDYYNEIIEKLKQQGVE